MVRSQFRVLTLARRTEVVVHGARLRPSVRAIARPACRFVSFHVDRDDPTRSTRLLAVSYVAYAPLPMPWNCSLPCPCCAFTGTLASRWYCLRPCACSHVYVLDSQLESACQFSLFPLSNVCVCTSVLSHKLKGWDV